MQFFASISANEKTPSSLDIVPISNGGESTPKNLQFICKTCNTRKGPLANEDFTRFLRWVRRQPQDMQAYVLRKMSAKEVFR